MAYQIYFVGGNQHTESYTFYCSYYHSYLKSVPSLSDEKTGLLDPLNSFIFNPVDFFNPVFEYANKHDLYYLKIFAKFEKQDNSDSKFQDRYIVRKKDVHFFMSEIEKAFSSGFLDKTTKYDQALFDCLTCYKNSIDDDKNFKKGLEINEIHIYNDQTCNMNSLSTAIENKSVSLKDIFLSAEWNHFITKTPKNSDLFSCPSSLVSFFLNKHSSLSFDLFYKMTDKNAKNHIISKKRIKDFKFTH